MFLQKIRLNIAPNWSRAKQRGSQQSVNSPEISLKTTRASHSVPSVFPLASPLCIYFCSLRKLILLLSYANKVCFQYINTKFTFITKTCVYNFDQPHFYIVKLGFTGVYIIFLISVQNIDYGYSLEPPRRGGSNEYPQSMF